MAEFNFDEIIDRRGTGALKYDVLQERYGSSDLLPLWVADMDFATPHFIIEAPLNSGSNTLYWVTPSLLTNTGKR